MRLMLEVVSAVAWKTRGIGCDGNLPWRLAADLKHFKKLTSGHAVIMGRRTWESLPVRHRPLKNRLNIVLSRTEMFHENMQRDHNDVHVAYSVAAALLYVQSKDLQRVFVIGGEEIYRSAMSMDECRVLHLTRVLSEPQQPCDTFFPEIDDNEFMEVSQSEVMREDEVEYQFATFVRRPNAPTVVHEEYQYIRIIREVMEKGVQRDDRTNTGTLSLFGQHMRFNLRNKRFPLLTTKRVFWRGVAEELLWFISGCTDATVLSKKGIRIWDGNGSREFLDKQGLSNRETGDLGPIYGFQWRHFGAEYKDMHANYSKEGVDQLAQVISLIKCNPDSRRILLSAWNPADLHKMALPPCHMFAQFFVAKGELSCLMYQRSCDLGLGVPFNIASYALLTRILAQVCGLETGDFIHILGDAHVYLNHVKPLQTQLERKPRSFPTLEINPDVTSIDDFKYEDFTIVGYKPHPTIRMEMAV